MTYLLRGRAPGAGLRRDGRKPLTGRLKILNTRTINYIELIGNGRLYRVPPYQRDYSWSQEQWEDLWNDIVELRPGAEDRHYMGALVVEGKGDREFQIIDGQQRLATLSLFALAVIDRLQTMAGQGTDVDATKGGQSCSPRSPTRPTATGRNGPKHGPASVSSTSFECTRRCPCFAAWESLREDFARILKLVSVVSCRYTVISRLNTNALEPVYHGAEAAYESSGYALTRRIPELAPEQWTPELVDERQRQLAARAVHLWRSDFA